MTSGLYTSPVDQRVTHYYNPSLLKLQDQLYIVPRKRTLPYVEHPHGFNEIVVMPLTNNKIERKERILQYQDLQPCQHVEDPRVTPMTKELFLLSATTFIRYPDNTWSGSHQILGLFDHYFYCLWSGLPPIGENTTTVMMPVKEQEKNWTWFFTQDGKLAVWYSATPRWIVCVFDAAPWEDDRAFFARRDYISPQLQWGFGLIRGGTPPILVDNLYWSFFHSATYWPEGNEVKYYVGAFAFEAQPPFRPKRMTTLPLAEGKPMGLTRRDKMNDTRKEKLVVFPCGAILENGEWLVTQGINDQRCGWFKIDHQDLYRLAKDVVL